MTDSLQSYRLAIEETLQALLAAPSPALEPLYGMMRYHLGWCDASFDPVAQRTGKRLRPTLTLLSCEALGGQWRSALPYAAAIELVHNFSLIHDDIEDDGAMRHERTTLWRVWGLAQGINTGDAMWCIARNALHGLTDAGHSAEVALAAVRLLDQACMHLCQGQYLDISFEGRDAVTVDEYLQMSTGKTAALLVATLQGGALLAGADERVQSELAAAGLNLGLAYQIVDDILGVWGDAQRTGKSTETDIATRKKTFIVAYALQHKAVRGVGELAQLYSHPSTPAVDAQILACLERCGARAYAREQARAYHEATLRHLEQANLVGTARDELLRLVQNLLDREY